MSGIGGINTGTFIPQTGLDATSAAAVAAAAKGGTEIDATADVGKRSPASGDKLLTKGMHDPAEIDKGIADIASKHLGSLGGDQVSADIYAFMALFAKMAQSMRDTARTQRTTEMQAQVSALQGAAEKMKEAAAARFAGALTQGIMQIAGGMMQAGLSAASAANTIKGAQFSADGKNAAAMGTKSGEMGMVKMGNAGIAHGTTLEATGAKLTGYGQSSGQIMGGLGGIASASANLVADQKEAEKSKLETQAKVAETGVQHANDMMQQMMDVIRDVREKLQSIQQAAVETNRGIARNI